MVKTFLPINLRKYKTIRVGYVYFLLGIIVISLILWIYYYCQENDENMYQVKNKYNLDKDGICILYNPKYDKETIDMPSTSLQTDILRELPEGYQFIDYIYKIENNSLSTFHRDVTSSKSIFQTKYPVYTVILYKYDGELFSFCPRSNHSYPFTWSHITNISGKKGTVFLFDSDLLHAGGNPIGVEREVVQFKVCHREDMDLLRELSGVRMDKKNVSPDNSSYVFSSIFSYVYKSVLRKASYFFEMPINYFCYPLMIKRQNSDHWIGKIQEMIPISFYNNSL